MRGSLSIGPYKGYHGLAEYDAEEGNFHGRVTDTKDVVSFVGRSVEEVETEFKASVDDYLEFCESLGQAPEKPYSGKILVRVEPKIHRQLSASAELTGVSLNQFIADVLARAVATEQHSRLEVSATLGAEATVNVDILPFVSVQNWTLPGSSIETETASAAIYK
jgi:predicted HicB family RNase H-like nuclease